MVEKVREIEVMRGDGVKQLSPEEAAMIPVLRNRLRTTEEQRS